MSLLPSSSPSPANPTWVMDFIFVTFQSGRHAITFIYVTVAVFISSQPSKDPRRPFKYEKADVPP
jgi:hypothetical protein